MASILTRPLLRLPPAALSLRSNVASSSRYRVSPKAELRFSSSLQSVTQPSFWASLVPKPLRRGSSGVKEKKPKSSQWNPATFYIVIFLLIGSMSIQMIALRNEFSAFMRRSDAKIDLLREVIERVKKGETVDVEGLLGSNNPEKEKEWEEVLKEIENEDELWAVAGKKKPTNKTGHQVETPTTEQGKTSETEIVKTTKIKTNAPRGFY